MKIAIISDVHSNLYALEAVLDEVGRAEIYHAGDVVGYNPFPEETIEIFRKKRIKSVMGNHDYAVVTLNTWGFNPLAEKAILWTRSRLGEEHLSYLESLAIRLSTENFYMVHGSPVDPLDEYVFPYTYESVLSSYLKAAERKILILGHTHVPFIKEVKEGLILNPGSVGQPRDGAKEASFAFLDLNKREAEIVRVDYPVEKTAKAIKRAGLPDFLAERLFYGK